MGEEREGEHLVIGERPASLVDFQGDKQAKDVATILDADNAIWLRPDVVVELGVVPDADVDVKDFCRLVLLRPCVEGFDCVG